MPWASWRARARRSVTDSSCPRAAVSALSAWPWRASACSTCARLAPGASPEAGRGCSREPHTGQGSPLLSSPARAPAVEEIHLRRVSRTSSAASWAACAARAHSWRQRSCWCVSSWTLSAARCRSWARVRRSSRPSRCPPRRASSRRRDRSARWAVRWSRSVRRRDISLSASASSWPRRSSARERSGRAASSSMRPSSWPCSRRQRCARASSCAVPVPGVPAGAVPGVPAGATCRGPGPGGRSGRGAAAWSPAPAPARSSSTRRARSCTGPTRALTA